VGLSENFERRRRMRERERERERKPGDRGEEVCV
jgi:hypothetical protein